MYRRQLLGAAAASAAALAGCASDGDGPADTTTTTTEETTTESTETTENGETTTTDSEPTEATVRARATDSYGDVLVDAEGMSLYLFDQDEQGGESTCYDSCASTWPPLTVEGEPTAGEGVSAELGTTERDDGSMQVTANGYPLYYYAGDSDPGDTSGQSLGGVWWLLAPDGSKIDGSSDDDSGGY